MKIYDKRFFIAILISILVSSCATAKREKQISSDLRKAALKLSQKNSLSGTNYYTVDQDDVLDITVWKSLSTKKGEAEEYFLNDGDKLEISVWQWPDLLKDVVVRPDGKISFPLIGDVVAQGRTLTDLDNEITEKLSAFIKSPEVSIMITAFGTAQEGFLRPEINFVKVNELSTEQTVAPDGNIYLPLFGAVQAGGLTLNQLSLKIKEKALQFVQNPEVSISIRQFGGRKLIVLGEVLDPGTYVFTGEATVLEAIGWAGGYTRNAVLKNVFVIRGDLANPQVYTLNLRDVLDKKNLSQDLKIQARDVVYVPRTVISEVSHVLMQLLSPLTSSSSAVSGIQTIRAGTGPKK
ncbi:MAG TPA: polysaccharide biosynthesis/export family protein [Candidatus Omnitrophota bacterium]|nr:polysaccharide biosynthesis/export family protein [Candidatus Omnitrophota bacterium]